MKSSRNPRQPYGNIDRKTGKRSEKAAKLDRKSSRGMIYENEELRLRTININAEVERGQTDIKRLRRENEILRREIWTLRDECDRLNKRFKAKLVEYDHGGCSARASGGSGGCTGRGSSGACDGRHSNSNTDDSDSCDTCRGDDDRCSDDCCQEGSCNQYPAKSPITEDVPKTSSAQNQPVPAPTATSGGGETQNLHANFDHLSVVSEETLSNSEMLAPQNENLLGYTPDISGSQTTLPSLVGPLTPLTPVELVANQLNDLQAMVPPLSYFENILQQHMGSNFGTTPDTASTTSTGITVKHTNGWDYNLQSPFTQRKYHTSSSSSAASRSPAAQPRYIGAPLTTFVSTPMTPPIIVHTDVDMDQSQSSVPSIETVAITTMPTNAPMPSLNSPKHFFAPLKPRLRINTSLANKGSIPVPVPLPPAIPATATTIARTVTTPCTTQHRNFNPPDIFVANALASPYQRQAMPKDAKNPSPPPPIPQRINSPQVSPRHRHRHNNHHHHHQHEHRYHVHRHLQQQQPKHTDVVVVVHEAHARRDCADVGGVTSAKPTTSEISTSPISNTKSLQQHVTWLRSPSPTSPTSQSNLDKSNNFLTPPNEPIYATAQNFCNNLISAVAVTKPLMTTATINTVKLATTTTMSATKLSIGTTTTTSTINNIATITTSSTPKPTTSTTTTMSDSRNQTDSANLESILNDIEHISEDILAIQLEKGKSRENLTMVMTGTLPIVKANNTAAANTQANKQLEENDKNKKPYRSEMNLLLTYDGTNPTITPATPTMAKKECITTDGNERRTRSLEREHTDSPSPNIPDAMAPFPENRTYIGFDQLNNAVGGVATTAASLQMQRPPLPPSQLVATVGGAGVKPATPPKPTPPIPPARMYPPPLNIRCTGVARSTPTGTPIQAKQLPLGSPMLGLSPNKSHLYAAIANAAAKRANFRSNQSQSKSLEAELGESCAVDSPTGEADSIETTQVADAAKRKARRVSIVCGDTNSTTTTPDHSLQLQTALRSPGQAGNSTIVTATTPNPSTASCSDLTSVLSNLALRNLKQTSHSTPNSPHSARRRSNSNNMAVNATEGTSDVPETHNHGTVGHHHSHSTTGLPTVHHRKSSQDSTRGNSAELAAAAAIVARSKCSRRHSDGTVASNAQRISGSSGGGGHHHHHHHHQHNSLLISNNPHHSHHSHQDSSNLDGGTSISDRNSNSLASSRESSTSFSMRSQRRKISVSSHTGGKIPWCGCWGNGCL